MNEDELIKYILNNKEWVFSGIGVLGVSLLVSLFMFMLNKRHRYLVCVNKSCSDDLRAFKVGISFTALIFSFLWVVYKGLYEAQFLYLGFILAFLGHGYILDTLFGTNILYYIQIVVSFIILSTPIILGIFGNSLIIRKYCHSYNLLSENHYEAIKMVVAKSELEAISVLMNKV